MTSCDQANVTVCGSMARNTWFAFRMTVCFVTFTVFHVRVVRFGKVFHFCRVAVPVTTDTGCSRAEQDRRRDIRKTTVFAQILVNGQVVATSPKAKLQWPNFTAHVPVSISVDVARRPERVQVQLWECGWVFNSLISSVDVPIPGSTVDESVASETVEPIDDWFTFSAVTPLPLSAVSFLPPAVSHVDGKTAPTR
jgi:CC2D2A N-terminal C2 domain